MSLRQSVSIADFVRLEGDVARLRGDVIEREATIASLADDMKKIQGVMDNAFALIGDMKAELAATRKRLSQYESVEAS